MVEVRRLFSTPFAIEMVGGDIDLAALRKAVRDEHGRDPEGLVHSNQGGWHSAPTMQHWGGDAARALATRAAAIADTMTLNTASPDESSQRWKVEMWANICVNGDSHQHHVHPGCVWSAVCYVDDGYGGGDDAALGGELQLLDPRMPAIRMAAPRLRLREMDGSEQLVEPVIRPTTGLLVVFPAWLPHAVRPFRGSGERISLAINLMA